MDYVAIRRALHQIPEVGFEEVETQAFLLDQISRMPQERVQVKKWKTGLLVRVSGTHPSKLIGFRTDIDALPVKEKTGYSFQSRYEGNMHACGHDFHMTIALGALENVIENPVKEDTLFIFQPAEEGPGGALPMMASDEFQSWKPDLIFGLHVSPDFPVGTVATKEGILFANTSELFIDFFGKGGHAAYPHLTHDTIVAASHFVVGLQTIVARRVDPLNSAVLTIGKISGGTKQNIIAEHARVEGTIRTLNQETMALIKDDIERQVKAIEIAYQCKGQIDYGANYYQVFNRKENVDPFIQFCEKKGFPYIICNDAMTGEDFGYFLKELPGFMFWLGVGKTSSLHSADFMPDEAALAQGVKVVSTYIREGV
ncbi:N-acetyldiaminopimelate deacetylase [Sporolactobacillus laevolacticus]|uniref:N-acetyldiaminopimelate deacetylase n=1 Tax=Sporolactobacillus laevolacticus DSM 442 TaxID=1395513 RepID=V6J051_9BACL|nr:N-acetyldiaminopimelate deacetylase [Sporolactobacillus laevolacticus]EST13182.1 N-acetyldiaminopimelate deacetylase [Sporolactobacillus laevolacticus DSM 442]